MDWDLENENLKLEGMIHIYEKEIDKLQEENKELEKENLLLKRRLRFYQSEEESRVGRE